MQRHLGWMVLVGALAATVYSACQSPVAAGGIMLTGQWGSEQGRFTATQVSTVFDGVSRHTREGYAFASRAMEVGWKQAVTERDAEPF